MHGDERWYDDACGTAHALELVGERWALLVVRELVFGPRRFGELRASLPGLSANILTQRLDGLMTADIVQRRMLASPANVQVYELTVWGHEADAAIMALGRWAARSPKHDPSLPLSAASLMLSFRTMLDRERAHGLRARIGFCFGADTFVATLGPRGLEIARGLPELADVRFTAATPMLLAAAVYGGQSFEALEKKGQLLVEGDRKLARRFTTLFPLPEKFVPSGSV